MTARVDLDDPGTLAALVDTASDPGFGRWQAMVAATGGCAQPIHLIGESRMIHAGTGEVLSHYTSGDEPNGRLLVACGNRRRTRCPSSAETYRADTYQLIKAGLTGGKNVPDAVVSRPKVFATFTAPSFGAVHHRVVGADGRVRRCHPHGPIRCRRRHDLDDPQLGEPLDPDSYEYIGAVLWNALSTRLWARTVQLVNRAAASLLGISQRDWPDHGRVSVAKVAEFQARGAVHFHAVFRLDGPDGAGDPPPAEATAELLGEAITQAATIASIASPTGDPQTQPAPIVWGDQLDLRVIAGSDAALEGATLTDGQVAGYVAKYACKGTEASGAVDRPVACRECQGSGRAPASRGTISRHCQPCDGTGAALSIKDLQIRPHAKMMIATCWHLGGIPGLVELRLRPWAHMLGFRGHFATKSRRYSTTLGSLRDARHRWRMARTLGAHGLDATEPVVHANTNDPDALQDLDEDTVLIVSSWRYAGRGHSPGEALFAATIAADLAESRRLWRQSRNDDDRWEAAA